MGGGKKGKKGLGIMNKKNLIIIFIISHHSSNFCIEPISTATLITIGKIAGVVGAVGGVGYKAHKLTKKNAKKNLNLIIQDMNNNHRTNDEQQRKMILKKYGHVFNQQVSRLIESYLNLHDTPIPTTYRNITGLIIGQNLNRQNRRNLIEILRAAHRKPLATLWLYRELKEIKGQKIIDHVQNQ